MAAPIIVSRADWGAQNPVSVTSYNKENYPIFCIYFTLKSGYPDCEGKEECTKTILEAQKKAIEQEKLPDIPYNFIISKDGTIFEGRGWETKPQKAIMMEGVDFDPRAYDIAYFGDYSTAGVEVPDLAFKASMDLLDDAVKRKYVDEEYDIEPFRADKFEPVLRPGPEKFKDKKPIVVKGPIKLKQFKEKYRHKGKRPPPKSSGPGKGPKNKQRPQQKQQQQQQQRKR